MMIDDDERLTFYYHGKQRTAAYVICEEALRARGHSLVKQYDEFLIDVYLMLDKIKSRHIALDWDNTISADQDFFKQLIRQLQKAGYMPFVCSLRAPNEENMQEFCEILDEAMIPVYLTDGWPKRRYMKMLGVKVHLWIDDFYPAICGDACKLLERNKIV